MLTIGVAAVLVFDSIGGGLVPRETAEVWTGLRSTADSDVRDCRLPFDCDTTCPSAAYERAATAYIGVLAKIAVLLSGMAMVGSIGAIREREPQVRRSSRRPVRRRR